MADEDPERVPDEEPDADGGNFFYIIFLFLFVLLIYWFIILFCLFAINLHLMTVIVEPY
jgi:hypothetical protein